MMDSPEARPVAQVPWLFGAQGLGLLAFITAVAATFLATDVAYLAGALLLVGLGAHGWARLAFVRITYLRKPSRLRAFRGDELMLDSALSNPRLLPLPWVEVWELLPAGAGSGGCSAIGVASTSSARSTSEAVIRSASSNVSASTGTKKR